MAIYDISDQRLHPLEQTSFESNGIREREHLQQLLINQIDVLAPDTLILCEEFSSWLDSRRRIDLLGVDKQGVIVVIELKRSEDGGHMDLQALRYAAMVSTLTFDQAADVYQQHLDGLGLEADARERLLEFLDWETEDEGDFGQDVRIVLASADFSKEITTTVLWLNERGLDVRCVRLRPYRDAERTLLDIQQIIPLPEAEEYQIQVHQKMRREQEARRAPRDLTKFWVVASGQRHDDLPKRRAIYRVVRGLFESGIDPEEIRDAITWRRNTIRIVPGDLSQAEFEAALTEQLESEGNKPDPQRFFAKDDELMRFGGKTGALTKMWGRGTERAMRDLLAAFPDAQIRFGPMGRERDMGGAFDGERTLRH